MASRKRGASPRIPMFLRVNPLFLVSRMLGGSRVRLAIMAIIQVPCLLLSAFLCRALWTNLAHHRIRCMRWMPPSNIRMANEKQPKQYEATLCRTTQCIGSFRRSIMTTEGIVKERMRAPGDALGDVPGISTLSPIGRGKGQVSMSKPVSDAHLEEARTSVERSGITPKKRDIAELVWNTRLAVRKGLGNLGDDRSALNVNLFILIISDYYILRNIIVLFMSIYRSMRTPLAQVRLWQS